MPDVVRRMAARLGLVGIYGEVSYSVNQRTGELGMRRTRVLSALRL